jgi:hypothetical protein
MSKAFLSGGRGVVCVAAAALSSSITVLIATTLCGCTVGPDYHPPKQPMPAHW